MISSQAQPPARPALSEPLVIFLIAAVQFVNILDFVIVMPMGPDFAKALGIPQSEIGYIGGAYTLAAALAGLIGSTFLDRLDRRVALGGAMLGLVLGTAAGGFAVDFQTLVLARVVAGFFGGPATSIALSILSDVIPPERRGRAMGRVMGAFSVASIVGVPLGLTLSEHFGWRVPFFAVAGMGFLVSAGAVFYLPPLRMHLTGINAGAARSSTWALLTQRPIQLSYVMTAVVMTAGFIIIPNISAYLQGNLGVPREQLKWLYLAGGITSLITMQGVGLLVDRFGSFRVGSLGSAMLVTVLYVFFYLPLGLSATAMFVTFSAAMSFRNIAYNTLTSKVPRPFERARFQSIQSSVQHLASAAGAFLSAKLLHERVLTNAAGDVVRGSDGHAQVLLDGMSTVALISMGLGAMLPVLLFIVEREVKSRAATLPAPSAGAAAGESVDGTHKP